MDASSTPAKIEVFAPFSSAMDLTKLILFQPFDPGKWITIGFAAFLSHLAGGSGFNFNSKLANGEREIGTGGCVRPRTMCLATQTDGLAGCSH